MTELRLLPALALLLIGCLPVPVSVAPTPEPTPAVLSQPSPTATSVCHYRVAASGQTLNDLSCTPGEVDPTITQDNIATTICEPGWIDANRPRPSVAATDALKYASIVQYGQAPSIPVARTAARTFEEDHLIAREIGGLSAIHIGANGLPTNLWAEPAMAPNPKDRVEGAAKTAVCRGSMSLAQTQTQMAQDWVQLGQDLGLH